MKFFFIFAQDNTFVYKIILQIQIYIFYLNADINIYIICQ